MNNKFLIKKKVIPKQYMLKSKKASFDKLIEITCNRNQIGVSFDVVSLFLNGAVTVHRCGDHATGAVPCKIFCAYYNVYRLVVVSLFTTFALFCLQLLSFVLLDANKNKLLLLLLNVRLNKIVTNVAK